MARRQRQRIGPDLDVVRLARGLAIPGGDLRHWVSYATVAAIDDDGEIDLSDPNAIVITPSGVDVDVVLEPSGYPCTAKHGIAAGKVFVCGPIEVGDQVVVGIPDGDSSMVPRILAVVSGPNGAKDVVPVDDAGKPIFKNDRFLIFAKGVPIDLRTDGGAQLLLNPDGTIQVGAGADQQLVRGTDYRSAEKTMNSVDATHGLQGIWAAAAAACTGPLAPLQLFFTQAAAAIAAFELQATKSGDFLSAKNRTK
jgi:hypothetical protein